MKKILGIVIFLIAGTANADLFELRWTTTASALTGAIPGVVGEGVTTIFTVDCNDDVWMPQRQVRLEYPNKARQQ